MWYMTEEREMLRKMVAEFAHPHYSVAQALFIKSTKSNQVTFCSFYTSD